MVTSPTSPVDLTERAARGPFRFAGAAAVLAILIVGTNMPSSLYSVYEQKFGFSPLTVTMIVSVYVAVLVPSLLIFGPLADSGGTTLILLSSFSAALVASALFAAAHATWWLFAARAAQGLAVGTASAPLTVALVRTEPRGNRARASLLGTLMTTGGAGLGPVVAGGLAQYGPAPLRLCYLVEFGLLVAALLIVATLPGVRSGGRAGGIRRPRVPAEIRGAFLIAAAASFLAWAVAYIVLALVPSYVEAALHSHNLLLGGTTAGGLLLCSAVVQAGLAGWLPGRSLAVGLVLLAGGLAGLIAAGAAASPPLLLATIAVTGAGHGLAFMGALRRVNDIAPPAEHAGVAAAFYVITYLGGGGPVIVVGLLATHMSLVHAVQIAAAVIAAACVLTLVAHRRTA